MITIFWKCIKTYVAVSCAATILACTRATVPAFELNTELTEVLDTSASLVLLDALSELDNKDIVLIGENHDNPIHHAIQLEVLEYLHRHNRLGKVILEHLDTYQAQTFNRVIAESDDLNELKMRELLKWDKSGWPEFSIFYPIFSFLLEHNIPVVAGHLDRATLMSLYRGEIEDVIHPGYNQQLGMDKALPPKAETDLLNRIKDAHCGALTIDHAKAMLPLQRYRDGYLAAQWLENQALKENKTTVYLLGNEHARQDYGVPYYLYKANSQLDIISLLLQEKPSLRQIDQHYTHTISTPKYDREDPCDAAREQLHKYSEK